jgi:hypothetical protein
MKYGAYRGKRGYEVARENEKLATREEDRVYWKSVAQKWKSRWSAIDA